jgi:hypothetical protein
MSLEKVQKMLNLATVSLVQLSHASKTSEEVQKMLNPATVNSVQLSHASSRTHSSLHGPFCFYVLSNSRHYQLQFHGADPMDDDCNLFDEMATRPEV